MSHIGLGRSECRRIFFFVFSFLIIFHFRYEYFIQVHLSISGVQKTKKGSRNCPNLLTGVCHLGMNHACVLPPPTHCLMYPQVDSYLLQIIHLELKVLSYYDSSVN